MKSILAEFLGTALLVTTVAGSGIMGETLASGNIGIALLANSIATGASLYVLITVISPISGAHFNPSVSLMFWAEKKLTFRDLIHYQVAQITGGIFGIWLTHVMFSQAIIQFSAKPRYSMGLLASELIATIILLAVIRITVAQAREKVATVVALIVTSGYWFTSSTFFANPAVTVARAFTDTFVGIKPEDAGVFLMIQLLASVITILSIKFISSEASISK